MRSTRDSEGDKRAKLMHLSPNPVAGKCAKILRKQGSDLVIANSVGDALNDVELNLWIPRRGLWQIFARHSGLHG